MTTEWPSLKRDLVAILRGIRPEETAETVEGLIEAGFEAIEIPLNSPEPFRSIKIAAEMAGDRCLVGAGTVLTVDDADRVAQAGGRLFVSPNVEPTVIRHAASMGMVTMPGVFTPTEALAALAAGASGLKFFPASVLGPGGVAAIRAVLPADTVVAAVGGVSERDFAAWARTGVRAFGLGSSLYKPGMRAAEVAERGRTAITAYDDVFPSAT